MISHISKLFFFGFFLFSIFGTFIPLSVSAQGLVPCGRSIGTEEEQKPCTICHIVVGGDRVIEYGLKIMTFVAIAVIVAMAIFYIVSTGDEGMMQTAKSGIKAALIGFAVMLGAWLIVNTTVRLLSATIPSLDITSSGFGFSCDTTSSAGAGATTGRVGAVIAGTPLVTVSDISSDIVTVSWLPPAGSDSQTILNPVQYLVYRDNVEVATVTTPTYTDTDVTPNTTYTYTVSVVDTAGNTSTQSTGIAATTPVVTDSVPISAVFTSPLSGARVSGAVNISVDTNPSGANLVILNVNGNFAGIRVANPYYLLYDALAIKDGIAVFTWDSTGVPDGPTTLSAIMYDGFSGKKTVSIPVVVSNATPIPTVDTIAPAVPTNLTATPTSASQINLSWGPSVDKVETTDGSLSYQLSAGYKIYRNGTQITTTTAATYSDTGLTAATTYTYTVQAFDVAGNGSAQTAGVSATTLTPTPTATPTTPDTPSATKKYHPGHYVQMYKSDGKTQILDVLSQAGVAGIQRYYGWWEFETSEGVYDFSKVKATLDIIKAYNASNGTDKRLVVQVGDKTFDSAIKPLPAYMDAYALAASATSKAGEGWVAQRWHPYVIERYSALFAAMGKQFDAEPLFEGVATSESAFSLDGTALSSAINGVTYTPQLYRDALIAVLKNAAQSFPASNVFWYQNFFPSPSTDKYLDEVATAVAPYDIIMGGPDVLPDSKPLLTRTYPRYTAFQGKMKLFIAAMTDSYREEHLDTTKYTTRYWTPNEMFLFARDNLHVNYIFWTKVCKGCADQSGAGLTGTYSWLDAIPVFKANPTFNVSTPPGTADTSVPTKPANFTASDITSTGVTFTWSASTDNVGVVGYNIYRDTKKIATPTATTYTDDTLSPGTSYIYTIAAYDAAGNQSTKPAGVTVVTLAPAPTATLAASSTAGTTGGSSTLTWSSTDATSCSASGAWSGIKATSGTETLTNLTTTGIYTLTCTGTGGTATKSVTVIVTAPVDATAPTVPAGLTATPTSASQINLSWTASTDTVGVTGYKAYRNGTLLATTTATTLSDTGLTAATAYTYTVQAFDAAGNGSVKTAGVSATTQPSVSTTKKYHPGHYITMYKSDGKTQILSVIKEPGVAGIQRIYNWSDLETSKDVYDFSAIQANINILKEYNTANRTDKRLIIRIGDKNFKTTEKPLPTYMDQYNLLNTGNVAGYTAKRWDPYVVERYSALFAAIGKKFDSEPLFEGASNVESAMGFSGTELKAFGDYTPEKYQAALTTVLINGAKSFPTSHMFWYMNFFSKDHSDDFRLGEIAAAVAPYDVVMGGPDVLPDNDGLVNRTYHLYSDFNGKMKLFGSMQNESYRELHVGTTTYWTMAEMFRFARDTLHVNYIFWNRVMSPDPAGSNNLADAIPVINANPTFNVSTPPVTNTPLVDTTAPTVPTNLTATPTSASQINLSWTASTDAVGVTGYKAYRNGTLLATTTATTLSDTGLTAATAYTYTVQAFDAAGNGSVKTAGVSATTLAVSSGNLVVYPAPQDVVTKFKSSRFAVTVLQGGASKDSLVYQSNNSFKPSFVGALDYMQTANHWTTFSFGGSVQVEAKRLDGKTIQTCVIRPLALNIHPTVQGNKCTFTLAKPAKVSVEIDENFSKTATFKEGPLEINKYSITKETVKHPLFVFADPLEVNAPTASAPGMLYYGPGIHNIGKKYALNNDTQVYIAGGAVVIGNFTSSVKDPKNITIRGRGILSAVGLTETAAEYSAWGNQAIDFSKGINGSNLLVEGITITDPLRSCIVSYNPTTVRNVKMFSWEHRNDGVTAGTNSVIEDSFIKAQDDNIKLYYSNQTVRRTIVWQQTSGAVFKFAWALSGVSQGHNVSDIDVIHSDVFYDYEPAESDRPDMAGDSAIFSAMGFKKNSVFGTVNVGQDTMFKNIRVEEKNLLQLMSLRMVTMHTDLNGTVYWGDPATTSSKLIDGVTFENVQLAALPYKHSTLYGNKGGIIRNLQFKGLKINGTVIDNESKLKSRNNPTGLITAGNVGSVTFSQ